MFATLKAAVLQLMLIPWKCIPVNDLLVQMFGPTIGKAAGAAGGIVFPLAIAMTVISGVVALVAAFNKNFRQAITNVFKPAGVVVVIIVAIAAILTLIKLADTLFCQ